MQARSEPYEPLRAALARLAEAEIPGVMAEARAGARARAKALIEDAMVQELVRAAAAQSNQPAAAQSNQPAAAPKSNQAARAPRESAVVENEQLEGEAWWAYCILAATERDAAPVGAPGVEPGSDVRVVQEGHLVAVVSTVPLAQFSDERLREHLNDIDWVERVARAHQRVLDQALVRATILPLRLCTLYRDEDGVRRMLREQEPMLNETLAQLRGRREWGVKVFVDPDRLGDALAESSEPETASEARASDPEQRQSGADYMARLGRERRASERLGEYGDDVVAEIHARLESVADSARTNPLQRPELHGRSEQMLLNGAYLVSREREPELRQVAQLLRERWSEAGFEVELTGPWPPYNFGSPSAMVAP